MLALVNESTITVKSLKDFLDLQLKSQISDNDFQALLSRLEYVLRVQGKKKSWLAEQLGISQQHLHNLLYRNQDKRHLTDVAGILNVNEEYLVTGKGVIFFNYEDYYVCNKVPLLKWGATLTVENNKQSQKEIGTNIKVSCLSYAYHLAEDFDHFKRGSYIIIDPSKPVRVSEYCIVKTTKKTHMSLFTVNDKKTYSFIRNNKPIESVIHVIGPIVEAILEL